MGLSSGLFGKVLIVGGVVLALKGVSDYLLPMLRAKNAGEKLVTEFKNYSFLRSNLSTTYLDFNIVCKNPANTPISFTYPFTTIKVDGKDFGSSSPKLDLITIPAFSTQTIPYTIEVNTLTFFGQALNTLLNKLLTSGQTVVTGTTLVYIEGTAALITPFTLNV